MTEAFEGSALNICSDRPFYLAMIHSKAFTVLTATQMEPHSLPSVQGTSPGGDVYGFDGFELYADVWQANVVPAGSMAAVLDEGWWSPKVSMICISADTKPIGQAKAKRQGCRSSISPCPHGLQSVSPLCLACQSPPSLPIRPPQASEQGWKRSP